MHIRIGHSTAFDFKTELYAPLRAMALPPDVVLSRPHETTDAGSCTLSFFEDGCALFIAEVSYASTGLGMEIGYADLLGIPVVCIHRNDMKPSSSLQRVAKKFLAYDTAEELQEHVSALLQELPYKA